MSLAALPPQAYDYGAWFPDGKPKVINGPFPEAGPVIGGYWIIQVKSKDEAVEWAKRCPALANEVIELRQVFEMADFPPEVHKAVAR